MNISGLLNPSVSTIRFMDCSKRAGASSFRDLLSDTQQMERGPIHMYLRRENTIYSGGIGYQTVYAEYTSDSTDEDPVVRIKVQASDGEFDFTCHINDIDPKQASYAEMCALFGHLQKTGQIPPEANSLVHFNVLPHGINRGKVTQKLNYMNEIDKMTTSQMFSQSNRTEAKYLLKMYQDFIDAKQQENETTSMDMDMRISGNRRIGMFSGGNAAPNIAASDAAAQMGKLTDTMDFTDPITDLTLRAAYDQLSIESKSVLDRMNAGDGNITQDEWTELCRELKDAGLITESDFMHTRANLRIVPIGYKDNNGNAVLYDNPPILSGLEMDTHLSGYSGLSKAWTVDDWSGDPLSYFDSWIESLRKWRNDLASQRNEDGTRKYDDLSGIGNNINSCEKVTNLMKMLMRFC